MCFLLHLLVDKHCIARGFRLNGGRRQEFGESYSFLSNYQNEPKPDIICISTTIISQDVRVAVSEDLAEVEKLYAEFNQVEKLSSTRWENWQ